MGMWALVWKLPIKLRWFERYRPIDFPRSKASNSFSSSVQIHVYQMTNFLRTNDKLRKRATSTSTAMWWWMTNIIVEFFSVTYIRFCSPYLIVSIRLSVIKSLCHTDAFLGIFVVLGTLPTQSHDSYWLSIVYGLTVRRSPDSYSCLFLSMECTCLSCRFLSEDRLKSLPQTEHCILIPWWVPLTCSLRSLGALKDLPHWLHWCLFLWWIASMCIFKTLFLVADTQLYKRLCPSVGRSVGP